jgi:hypothetical protein
MEAVMNVLLVKAAYPGQTISTADSEDYQEVRTVYEYKVGETGTLEWQYHPIDPLFLTPFVRWDNDPEWQERRVMFNDLIIIGVQEGTLRVRIELAKERV